MRTFLCSLLALEASAYVLQQPPMQQRHAERAAAPQMAATKVSRRKAKLDELVDAEKLYAPDEAVALLKKTASAKFVEPAELPGTLTQPQRLDALDPRDPTWTLGQQDAGDPVYTLTARGPGES